MLVAPLAARLALGIRSKILTCIVAILIWSAGMIVIGTSPTAIGVGAGSFISGIGFGCIFVVLSPFLVSKLPRAELHALPTYIGYILASSAFGVVVAYAISSASLDLWRWNFALSPVLTIFSLVVFSIDACRMDHGSGSDRKENEKGGGEEEEMKGVVPNFTGSIASAGIARSERGSDCAWRDRAIVGAIVGARRCSSARGGRIFSTHFLHATFSITIGLHMYLLNPHLHSSPAALHSLPHSRSVCGTILRRFVRNAPSAVH